ncbi:MAG: peptide deformylase [Anaerolineales bacterium]|nr:peptide deformylase [Anaerolineae bacterium]PWB49431.1 MAG: peptide deformylase [Anaerolineales bacterium]
MTVREIVALPQAILRHKAHKVSDFGPGFQSLVDDMVETMRQAPGVGLAAPQVDESLRLAVIEFGDEEDEEVPPKLYVIANPQITRTSSDTLVGTEGCLSIPGIQGDVERFAAVTVKGLNRQGKPMTVKAKGWLARIFQHEIDHLDGILFVDRAEKVWQAAEHQGQVSPDRV